MSAVVHAPRLYPVPKPRGGTRLMAELEPPDHARWEALARLAAPAIERALDPRVLANRWTIRGPEPLVPALARSRTASRAMASRADALLRTDVEAFYPSIRPGALARGLAACGVARQHTREIAGLLEGWEELGAPGLPIGPAPSALFANAVLAPVDAELRRLGVQFLRWVDDYLVAIRGRDPRSILEALDDALAAGGLSRHRDKTGVGDGPGAAAWLGMRSPG